MNLALRLSSLAAVAVAAATLWPFSQTAQAQTAQKPKAVVELFTSQGCSSCPKADAVLRDLTREPGVVALTFPVTYWDYLGWKDTLAHDQFSQRQRSYASGRGDGQVYTPQAVVNGAVHVIGSDRAAIDKAVARQGGAELPVAIEIDESGQRVRLSANRSEAAKAGSVWIMPVLRERTVVIARGENKGRTITYANVVRGMTKLGDWNGQSLTLDMP
ncbi:MAG: DUF1223 domain-containing protein, partial [Bosea sp. (in: a-proteobacteria)]